MTDRIKFAYLTYNDMISRIESGEINEYDIIYSKDRYIMYLITETLEPLELRSRVYTFSSVNEAENAINEATDTYVGQVVSILDNDVYKGYIVNKNDNKFIVTPLYEYPGSIDYNILGNRPIINMVGTLDEPIMISKLDDGFYKIKGQYKISDLEETTYLSASDIIFIVNQDSDIIKIKEITSSEIIDYIITSSNITKKVYITEQYLKDNNYVTNSYIDSKIEALKFSIEEDMQSYVKEIVDQIFTEELDKKIDAHIDDNIEAIDNSRINSLFGNSTY